MTQTAYGRTLPRAEQVPAELRNQKRWIAWNLKINGGNKPGKVPRSPINGSREWNSPDKWGDFDQAIAYAQKTGANGVGIVLDEGCGLAGGDLDHCRDPETGELTELAKEIIAAADTYTEISPGLSGLRFIARGNFGGHVGNNAELGVELYESHRFLTVTGNHLPGTPTSIEQRDLTDLGKRFFARSTTAETAPAEATAPGVPLEDLDLSDYTLALIEGGAAPGQRSEAIYGVLRDLIKAGADDACIHGVLTDPNNGISDKALEKGRSAAQWIQPQIDKLRLEVGAEQQANAEVRVVTGNEGTVVDPGQAGGQPAANDWPYLSLNDIMGMRLQWRYVVEGLILEGRAYQIFGGWKSGKSLISIDLGLHLADPEKKEWAGKRIEDALVVYIAGESQETIQARIQGYGTEHLLNKDSLFWLRPIPVYFTEQHAVKKLRNDLEKFIAENPDMPVVIFIDTLAQNFGRGKDESKDMQTFSDNVIHQIVRPLKATAIVIHHSGHGDKTRGRGGSQLPGAVDGTLMVTKDGEYVVLNANEQRDAPDTENQGIAFRIQPVDLEQFDNFGNPINVPVILHDESYTPLKEVKVTGKHDKKMKMIIDHMASEKLAVSGDVDQVLVDIDEAKERFRKEYGKDKAHSTVSMAIRRSIDTMKKVYSATTDDNFFIIPREKIM